MEYKKRRQASLAAGFLVSAIPAGQGDWGVAFASLGACLLVVGAVEYSHRRALARGADERGT